MKLSQCAHDNTFRFLCNVKSKYLTFIRFASEIDMISWSKINYYIFIKICTFIFAAWAHDHCIDTVLALKKSHREWAQALVVKVSGKV